MHTEREEDVPSDKVEGKIKICKASGAISVEKVAQPNGKFTIIATYEDEVSIGTTTPSPHDNAAIDTLARTLWGEARGESRAGKEGVASVILNRLKKPRRFGGTIEEVCRKPFQFSCWNTDDPNFVKLKNVDRNDQSFAECLEIAERAVAEQLPDSTLGADHYHTSGVSPNWSRGKTPCIQIGNHLFFNNIT